MKKLILGSLMLMSMATVVWAQGSQLLPLELNGTEWEIALSQDGSDKTSQDSIAFVDHKFSSGVYSKQKYEATNYTLSVKDDGSTTFDTMQTKGDDMVMWHGIVNNNGLRGVVSVHLASGKVVDYTFTGTLISGVLKLQEPSQPVVQEEPAAESNQ